jgi:hypothetical protein
MKIIAAMCLGLAGLSAWAGGSTTACYQDCFRQGYERSQCLTICERGPGGGLLDQPGVPRNPYLDALPDPVPKQQARQRPVAPEVDVDPRCLDDCRRQGHQYGYCRKQCSY